MKTFLIVSEVTVRTINGRPREGVGDELMLACISGVGCRIGVYHDKDDCVDGFGRSSWLRAGQIPQDSGEYPQLTH